MKIYLLDNKADMCLEWVRYFDNHPDFEVVCDDFGWFMNEHPEIDCVVSPANSYGLMDGGYDMAITTWFGKSLMNKVQQYIINNLYGEQVVGTSFIVDTDKDGIKLIHTPTMRVPSRILDPLVIYNCMRSTLICARQNNIQNIVIPAFGGATGGIDCETIARMMYEAYKQVSTPPTQLDWTYAYRWRL